MPKSRNQTLRPGTILLAEPFLKEPSFSRSAVLLCHIDEEGALGLVLNKPIDNPFPPDSGHPFRSLPFFSGGPVDEDHLFFLHQLSIPESISLKDGIFWQGAFESLADLKLDETQIRFFLGYSGWEAGQLEAEIEEDAWLIYNGPIGNLFQIPPEKLWKTLLEYMGPYFRMVSNFPLDPNLN